MKVGWLRSRTAHARNRYGSFYDNIPKPLKFIIIITTLILSTDLTFGQSDTVFIRYNKDSFEDIMNYKTDTIIFNTPNERQLLYGTTVLPWTGNQQIAKGFGLYLDKVSVTPCKNGRPDEKVRVLSTFSTDSTLKITLNILGNCCHSFLCDISVVKDSLINLIHYGYGSTYCSCICCFGLTYNISLLKEFSEFNKLKWIIINGDDRTLKKLN